MGYEITWTQYSKSDYLNLDGSQRVFVDKALVRIRERGMDAGQPLSGELMGCNKLKNKQMGLRIVFRQTDAYVEIIQIVAIGKRDSSEVYTEAGARLKKE